MRLGTPLILSSTYDGVALARPTALNVRNFYVLPTAAINLADNPVYGSIVAWLKAAENRMQSGSGSPQVFP